MTVFYWNHVQRQTNGRLLLLHRHQRVFDEGIVRPGHNVLDIGGWGVFAQAVIEHGAHCTILDAFTADQHYPERVRGLPHVVGDARESRHFSGALFDTVACFETLEHCGNATAVVANAFYWLRPGGMLVGTVPIPGRVHAVDEPGIEFLSTEQLRNLLARTGFQIERIEPTGSMNVNDKPCSIYFVGRKQP